MKPQRIQRKRSKGWRMPEGAVYVGRPTRWGNEFAVGEECVLDLGGVVSAFVIKDPAQAVALYRRWQAPVHPQSNHPLAGRDLACWCPLDQPCHADVLLELANQEVGMDERAVAG